MKNYQRYFWLALALHIMVFIAILSVHSVKSGQSLVQRAKNQSPIVHAVSVSQTAINQQISRIKTQQQQAKQRQVRQLKRLQQATQKARQQRLREQQRAAELAKQAALTKANLKKQQVKARALKAQALHQQQQQLQHQLLQQQLQQEQQALKKKRKKLSQAQLKQYQAQVAGVIRQNWISLSHNSQQHCVVKVNLSPSGEVLAVSIVMSSGNPVLDRLAKTAVLKSSPLPVPSNPQLFSMINPLIVKMTP